MAAPVKNAAQAGPRAQTRLALGAVLIPLFFAVGVRGLHHRHLPQAASERHRGRRRRATGSDGAAASLASRRGRARRSTSRQVTTVAEAQHDVRERDLDAAFVPTADPRQPATVIVASANGRIVATAAETFARTVTAAQGAQLVVDEVRPLASGDEIGLGSLPVHRRLHDLRLPHPDRPRDARPRPAAEPPLPDHRGDRRPGADARLPDRRPGLWHVRRFVRDDPRVHRRRGPLHVRDRPRHPFASRCSSGRPGSSCRSQSSCSSTSRAWAPHTPPR